MSNDNHFPIFQNFLSHFQYMYDLSVILSNIFYLTEGGRQKTDNQKVVDKKTDNQKVVDKKVTNKKVVNKKVICLFSSVFWLWTILSTTF